MTNVNKTAITKAIDAAGYEWQVSENIQPPAVHGEQIIIEETVVFTAKKRTEIAMP